MDLRAQKGQILAQDKRIKHVDGPNWFVPSQSGSGGYLVNLAAGTCHCDDFELRRGKCKHQWAVEFKQAGGSSPPPAMIPRKTYPQNWPVYHYVQCNEKSLVQKLLRGLCDGILSPPHPGRGPKPVPLSDMVYAMVMRIYLTLSCRRTISDLKTCADAGHISRAPRANTVIDYFGDPALTPLLQVLIQESASPLACVESQFAADATGFGTCIYRRWFDHKYGREMKEHVWLKAHCVVGVKTNTVAAVRVTEGSVNDCPELPPLLTATDRHFTIKEVSADKAYLSHDNLAAIEALGAVPYIPFKSNSKSEGSAVWRRMWAMFVFNHDEWTRHYHQRSNSEATFSAVKRKFGAAVRSKTFVAQTNEILCKLLCHNLCCLVQAMHELGIRPEFDIIPAMEVAA